MSSNNKLSHIGGYQINTMLIIPYKDGLQEDPIDPRENMSELNIYESVDSNSVFGELILEENSGLEGDLHERDVVVYFDISTPGEEEKIQSAFYVYFLEPRVISPRTSALVMHFTSLEEAKNNVARVQTTFGQDPMLEEISSLLTREIPNGLEVNDIEENFPESLPLRTKPLRTNSEPVNRVSFASNKWRPYRCINYMANRALSDSGSPSYVFFERLDGYMLLNVFDGFQAATDSPKSLRSYFYKPGRTEGHEPGDDADQRYSQVLEFIRHDNNDELENSLSGAYGSNLNHLDLLTKRYQEWRFDPEDQTQMKSMISEGPDSVVWKNQNKDVNESKPLKTSYGVPLQSGKQKLIDSDDTNLYDQRTHFSVVAPSYVRASGSKLNFTDEYAPQRWFQARHQFLSELETLHFQISSYGRTNYHAGQFVKLNIPARRPMRDDNTAENILDERESGIYLVSKIRHQFTASDHMVHMDLVRDCFSSKEYLGVGDIDE